MHAIYNWLEALGFKFYLHRKTYYIDGHKQPDNIGSCIDYINIYLKYERRFFGWIQLPIEEVEK